MHKNFYFLVMNSHLKPFDNLNHRLDAVANRFQSYVGRTSTGHKDCSNDNIENLPVLRDYNTIINESMTSFVALSCKIGGELSTITAHVTRLFNAQREFLRHAIQINKPATDQQVTELIKPQSNEIETIIGKQGMTRILENMLTFVFSFYK